MIDFETFLAVTRLYTDYASVLDNREWDKWPEFFTEDCIYKVQPRENYERGLPLATIAFESKGMLKDRIFGATETIYHDIYHQRHVVGTPLIHSVTADTIESEANYAVFRSRMDELTTVFNVGRYIDVIRRTPQGLKLQSRICVFDSEIIPNSLIYPI